MEGVILLVFFSAIIGFIIGGVLAGLWAAFAAFGVPPITYEQGLAVAYLGAVVIPICNVGFLIWSDR